MKDVISNVERENQGMPEESSTRLFSRIVGLMFILYGFFSFVAPDLYGFGDLPHEYTQIFGLVFVALGLTLILKRGKFFG